MRTATLVTPAPGPRSLSLEDVSDGISAIAATYLRPDSAGVCVADGMGARISVERGALVVSDGMGEHRRERRFDKATHGLARVVLLASTGTVSLDALHWCSRLGIGVVVLGSGRDATARLDASDDRRRQAPPDAGARTRPALRPRHRPVICSAPSWPARRSCLLRRFGDEETACDDPRPRRCC